MRKIYVLFFMIFVFLIINNYSYYASKCSKIEKIDLKKFNKLMIVAHPDDETLWGGAHLLEDNYLVVCVTCGNDVKRNIEFVNLTNTTKDKYMMLEYPDKTNGERDDWKKVKKGIEKDLKKIINYKNWEVVVTHNPDGEYGHVHHKMTSEIVTSLTNHDKLYYFGKYYTKKNIQNVSMKRLDKNIVLNKKALINIYKTQSFIKKGFGHMNEYENWVSYKDWWKVLL